MEGNEHYEGEPKFCPQCGEELCEVVYRGGDLHRSYHSNAPAGEWHCELCPDNGRGAVSGYCYWRDHEVLLDPKKRNEP